MTALLLSFGLKFWPYILAGFGILFGLWKVRQSGANSERAKQAAAEAKARTIADEIDDAVAGRSPDANREELRKWSPKS